MRQKFIHFTFDLNILRDNITLCKSKYKKLLEISQGVLFIVYSKRTGVKIRVNYFFLVKSNTAPHIAGITIKTKAVMSALSSCWGVGNHSNEPVHKYKRPKVKIIQIIIHKIVRSIFIPSSPWVYYMLVSN